MSITSLRPIPRHAARPVLGQLAGPVPLPAGDRGDSFGLALLRAGQITAATLVAGLNGPQRSLIDHVIAVGALSEDQVYTALAAHWAVGRADFARYPIDPTLLARVDAAECLAKGWLPWRKFGASTVIVCAYPENFAALRAKLPPEFGTLALALAPRPLIEAQILAQQGGALARRAETRLPEADSCRSFSPRRAILPLGCAAALLALATLVWPAAILDGLIIVAIVLAMAQIMLKTAAAAATLRPNAPIRPSPTKQGLRLVSNADDVPFISVMVPLYRESRIVARLIRRLDQLDYPRTALEVILLIEDSDRATAMALSHLNLPPWIRTLSVPAGTIRTKPRALNYGLDHCKGDIIGVYDAEDAPEAGQLRQVAAGFAAGGARLACLQGRLDYYNPTANWLSRCFTIEYATWWRVVLPGLSRLGFAIPLGGTTLFFRRDILANLGGWDAHNVTEDADLGIRIARRGYKTALFDSTTFEEANCRALPWVKQRSRWIKGYIMTYIAHMRRPRQLLAEMGAWRFFGFQMMFAGSVLQALLAPVLLALWLVPFGQIFPIQLAPFNPWLAQIMGFGLLCEVVMILVSYMGLRRAGHRLNPLWIPTMTIYNALASIAAYKAVYEVLTKPFYWDKTAHGLFDD